MQGQSVAWPRGGCRKPRHGAGVARRSSPRPSVRQWAPPLPASGGRPAHGVPSGAARARTLALRPSTGRAGTAADSARTQLQAAWRPDWLGARRGPGAAAREAGQGSRTGHASGLDGLASEAAGERRERCRPPRQGAPLGVPGPESERSPATATLAGLGGHAPRPAPLEPPTCSLHGRCGDDQVEHATPGQARPGAPGRSIWRPNAPPCGQPERPQQGASQAEPSLGASPADRPRTGVMWNKFRQKCYAARVLRPNST